MQREVDIKMDLILNLIECQSILQQEYDANIHKELDLDFIETLSRIPSLLRVIREYPEISRKIRAKALKELFTYEKEGEGGSVEKLFYESKPWNQIAQKYLEKDKVYEITELIEKFRCCLLS